MYEELREQCYELNMQLADSGLIKQTFGNVSVVDREHGVMAIKPSGVEYSKLRVEDIPVMALADGKVVYRTESNYQRLVRIPVDIRARKLTLRILGFAGQQDSGGIFAFDAQEIRKS